MFPGKDMKEGDRKHLLISSPDRNFLKLVEAGMKAKAEINIGEMQFSLEGVRRVDTQISGRAVLKTATPIIIRIPQHCYSEYGISSQHSYVFWRPEHDFNAFLKQLSENIIKKYNEYHGTNIEEQYLFQQFVFDGSYPVHPVIDKKEQTFIASYWKFIFDGINKKQRRLLEFATDCGFGELNSLGFGFVNLVK